MPHFEVPERDIVGIRADNPGPFTLTGTNTWVVGSYPAWLIDPGPALDAHLSALVEEIGRRGGLGGIALTHDHPDHAQAAPALRAFFPRAPLVAARGDVDHVVGDGDRVGPLQALAMPGHAPDHFAYLCGDAAFCGDAILGQGSVFIAPDPGALTSYLSGLEQLRARHPAILLPGHGPVVADPEAKIDEYIEHRLSRERRLLAALAHGARSVEEMLDSAWDDVSEVLRPAAAVTLAAHLDKLAAEGRLPTGVQRPSTISPAQAP